MLQDTYINPSVLQCDDSMNLSMNSMNPQAIRFPEIMDGLRTDYPYLGCFPMSFMIAPNRSVAWLVVFVEVLLVELFGNSA